MNDRELLEMAARAAGIETAEWTEYTNADPVMVVRYAQPVQGFTGYEWNPLANDGDALRLAVSIPACIVIDNDMMFCGVHLNGNRGKYDLGQAFVGLDNAAATRRAIVRAAAAIGDGME